MCGITGFWSFHPQMAGNSLDRIVTEMANQLVNRGPDSSGVWCDPSTQLAFAHRRLSIVDLSETGHQPMVSASTRFVISYNGEIYNTSDLKKDLISRGYPFKGHSDTEVILAACEFYGVLEATKLLNGMFAFSLWDKQDQKLFLVRDRLGIKPLYWGFHNQTFFFGSQIKSFRPHPLFKPKLNREILPSYFRFGYVPGPFSIYTDIQKLSPGCIATITGQNQVTITPYWSMDNARKTLQTSQLSETEWIDQLDHLLRDATQRCMVSDVPLGAFLSGGIDSSTVVALMQAQNSTPIQTFSIGFEEEAFNEATHAAAVARHLGTNHHELYLKSSQALDIIPTIPQWCDEPFADSSQIPTYLVSQLAQKHVKVCLSGDGGDEFFAGYGRYFQTNQLQKRLFILPYLLRKLLSSGIQALSPSQWDYLNSLIPGQHKYKAIGDKAHKLAALLSSANQHVLYLGMMSHWENPADLVPGTKEHFSPLWNGLDSRAQTSFIEKMQYIDSLSYLPDDILSKVDYASMAVSLESRVPLLDHRVVEFSWGIPLELKTRHPQGKWILREVLKRYVPESLFERPKMGFGVPIDQWLRGALRPWAEELLSQSALSKDGLLNPDPIRKRWEEHLKGTRNWHYSLWPVLMFQAWRNHYGE